MGGHSYATFAKRFTPMYQWSSLRGKPLIVWVGLPENPYDPGWKADYLNGMRTTIQSSMPEVKATFYYNAWSDSMDWRADTSGQSWNAYKSLAYDPYFHKGSGTASPTPSKSTSPSPTQTAAPSPTQTTDPSPTDRTGSDTDLKSDPRTIGYDGADGLGDDPHHGLDGCG